MEAVPNDKPGMDSEVYIVTLRSTSIPHILEATTVEKEGDQLVFRDEQRKVTGSFNSADVMGHSIEPEPHVG